ncbi:MAG: ABC transporter substrate-binding protein [Desulfobacca sp.]|uniref:ABC transporter substrate-binding protein n=1 Tax=Desulfobacca sp. TaxID=2067990 RepID=UPI004049FE2C
MRARGIWQVLGGLCYLALVCGVVGCGASSAPEVRLGVNAELTGSKPTVGDSCKRAMELLAEQINQQGGLKVGDRQLPLKLVIEDNEDKAESAAAAAQKLISQNNVLAVIGPNASGNAIPAARICEDSGVIMISPWSTNPKTTEGKKYIFRACFIDDFQGQVMAKFARQHLKAETAAVLYDVASEYNKGIAEFFKQFFEADGGKVVAFASYTTGDKDFSSQLTTIKAAAPQVLFLPNYYNEVPLQVKQARQQGLSCAIIGSDSWGSQELLTLGGADLEKAFFSTHYAPDIATPKAQEFIQAYEAKYGKKPDDVAALTYDAGLLLCQAITQAGVLDRSKVRDTLAQVKEFEGVTGKMTFRGGGDPLKSAVILQVHNGQFKYFASVHP